MQSTGVRCDTWRGPDHKARLGGPPPPLPHLGVSKSVRSSGPRPPPGGRGRGDRAEKHGFDSSDLGEGKVNDAGPKGGPPKGIG